MSSHQLSRRWTPGAFVFAAFAFAAVPAATPAALVAQDDRADARTIECRCVDASGEEIENCTCFRGPNVRVFTAEGLPGFTRRAMIGVNIRYDQSDPVDERGARIEDVSEGMPAAEAGFRTGDVVTHVNGVSLLEPLADREVEEALDWNQSLPVQRFVRLVGALEPGEEAEFRIERDGTTRTLTVVPEESDLVSTVFSSGPLAQWRGGDGPNVLGFRGEGPAVFEFRDGELRDRLRMNEEDRARLRERMEEVESRVREYRLREDGDSARVWIGGGDGEGMVRLFGNGAYAFGSDPCVVGSRGARGLALSIESRNCMDGVELVDLNPGLGSYFGTTEGVLVTEVHEGATLGLQPGDVLLSVDGREVADREEAIRVFRSYDLDDELRLRVRRDGREVEVLGRRRAER